MRWKLALFLALFGSVPLLAQVRVSQGTLEIPVYEEGQPDPNPPFDQYASTRFSYPYTLRKELTDHRVVHQLRAIYLENEYLKCSVLPDIGGHIYTCVDKINGRPMFYANPSIKKADIGYRGAWAAFGVEFNFPVSHNWMSMSPVDFAYASHPDGSASVTVGNIDRVYGMEWSVELILRPGSTVLEQRVRLSNRSDVRHRFYWWSNAGVQIWDDSHIEYPMRFAAAHGFAEVQRWPVDDQGKDLSVIKNQTDGPVSVFVHGSREDFMGIWHPHTSAGTAHFAKYDQLPAKKIWSWGVDADGLDWRKALSDNNSAYAEVQGGLFRNQETYAFLEPREHIAFSEFWMPVRGIGGISRANLAGAVHLATQNNKLLVALNVNQKLDGATLRVRHGNTEIAKETGNLSPEKTWSKEIPIRGSEPNYTFELADRAGTVLLTQTLGQYDWLPESEIKVGKQDNYRFPDEKERTEDDWLQLGKNLELDGNLLGAVGVYQKALKKFPNSFELQKAAGRLDAGLQRFQEALPNLSSVHARNQTDGEASYYLGVALEGIGNFRDAVDAYQAALRSPNQRAAAAVRLAEMQARDGNLQGASDLLDESLQASPDDLRALEEQLAIRAALGQTKAMLARSQKLLPQFPTSDFLKELAGTPDLPHLAADPYRVLRIAAEYARLGLYSQALTVLSRNYPSIDADQREPGTTLPQENALVLYFLAYCKEKLGQPAAEDYARASRLSTLYVFPSTMEDRRTLQAALHANANDATAHFLRGTWYFARAKAGEALNEWNVARSLNSKMPALQASLGLALLRQGDFEKARDVFEEGVATDPRNAVNYSGALAAMSLLGTPAHQRAKVLERYPDLAAMPNPLVYDLALNRAESQDFQGAIALFHNRFFGREEGGTNVRQVWIEVKLQRALNLAKSGNCPAALDAVQHLESPAEDLPFTKDGLNPFVETPRTSYLAGEIFSACGKAAEAKTKFEKAAEAKSTSDLFWAWAARRKLASSAAGGQEQLASAAVEAESLSTTSGHQSWWLYNAGILRQAAGDQAAAKELLQKSLLEPDSGLSHHLARLALAGSTLP